MRTWHSRPSIADALVVGVADARWGQSITAIVHLMAGEAHDEIALKDFLSRELAGYKVSKRILAKDDLERAPNGKANYKLIKEFAERTLVARPA